MFALRIHTDTAAFQDGNAPHAIARILREVAALLESGDDDFGMYRNLRDTNGNSVGQAKMFREGVTIKFVEVED